MKQYKYKEEVMKMNWDKAIVIGCLVVGVGDVLTGKWDIAGIWFMLAANQMDIIRLGK